MKPSDCPFRPGTPEHTEWVHQVYMPWQCSDPETRQRADANHAAIQQRWRDMEQANPQRVAADAIMREVEDATPQRSEPWKTFGLVPLFPGNFTVTLRADADIQFQAALDRALHAMALAQAYPYSIPLTFIAGWPGDPDPKPAPVPLAVPP